MESNALDITDHLHFTVSRSLSSRLCVWYSKNERVKEVGRNFHVICLLFPRWTLLLWFCSSVTWKLVRLVFTGCGMKKVRWIFLCVFCLSCNFMDWLIGLWFLFFYFFINDGSIFFYRFDCILSISSPSLSVMSISKKGKKIPILLIKRFEFTPYQNVHWNVNSYYPVFDALW